MEENKLASQEQCEREFKELKTHIIQEAIASEISWRDGKAAQSEDQRTKQHLPEFAMRDLRTTLMLSQITNDAKEWAERGEMTIQTISRLRIGGATEKKDRPEWSD